MNDTDFIRKTLLLAKLGLGTTWPNPLVGCVIVKNGRIIGEGYHERAGFDHAEIAALKNCKESPEGATLYVNLEPCCHTHKQTPPCAQRLIQEKIKKVIICNLDPNPAVNGKGVELLRSHGIEVEHGILKEEGEKLNEVFFSAQRSKRPFVFLKLASTLDGKIALINGESQWITGPEARSHAHKLRSFHQGIVVGAQTARLDNPKLNVRLDGYQGPQPTRLIFTKTGELPAHLHVLNDELKEKTLILTESDVRFKFPPEQVIKIKNINEGLHQIFERKIINLLLEGGPKLASEFLKQGFINRVGIYLNPSFMGYGKSSLSDLGLAKLGDRPHLQETEMAKFGEDYFISGKLCLPG